MTALIPPATHAFSTETYDPAEVRAVAVRLLETHRVSETRILSAHVGGHGDMAYQLKIIGRCGEFEISERDYGAGPEWQCTCPDWNTRIGCQHTAALLIEQELDRA